MQLHDLHGLTGALALTLLAACAARPAVEGPPSPESRPFRGYLASRTARRAILEASLVAPDNGYSKRRLAHYARDEWESLPEHNPPAAPLLAVGEVPLAPLAITDAARGGDRAALRALGEAAFFRYPVQIAAAAERGVKDEVGARRFGFWVDAQRGLGGLVRVRTEDGIEHLAYSCATCHAGEREGVLVTGVADERLDIGRLTEATFGGGVARGLPAWGPGRVDVTTREGLEPVRIPDLRPVRELGELHHTASVRQDDEAALAVRLETLIITSNGETVRPPREVALGLALYVWSLDGGLMSRAPTSAEELRGQALFGEHCASCHAPPSFSGLPRALAEIGTDPLLGRSAERGTGSYRVPSLRGVATRGLLLHDGSLSDVAAILDPARTEPTYRSRLGGPVPGHVYGLDLEAEARAALVAYLLTL